MGKIMNSFQGRFSSAWDYLANNWKVLLVKGTLVTILGFVGVLIDKQVWPEAGKPMPDNGRSYMNDTIKKTPILRRQEKSALPIPALVTPPLLFRLFVRLRTFVASGIFWLLFFAVEKE
jgi:hypothetical protein